MTDDEREDLLLKIKCRDSVILMLKSRIEQQDKRIRYLVSENGKKHQIIRLIDDFIDTYNEIK